MNQDSPSPKIICPSCKGENRLQARYCRFCGKAILERNLDLSADGYQKINPLQPGMVLDNRYKVIRKLGESKQGRVFLGQDVSGRYFALKQIRELFQQEDLDDYNQYIRSFQREAQILSSLPHPYLPIARDFLADKYLIVMDYIDGQTLAEVLENSPAPIHEKRAARWAIQLCDGLRYLHEKEPPIIHRNISPQNIILESGKPEHVRLIGFGMAHYYLPGVSYADEDAITPGFSPPEQYAGTQTDARSDLFSLGATLFTLLTKQSLEEFIQYKGDGSVEFRAPRVNQITPQLSDTITEVVEKALQNDPASRYQSALEMKNALEASLVREQHQVDGMHFTLGGSVDMEETRQFEFKEIKDADPKTAVKRIVEIYTVAFLNREGGSIFWGIRDSDRVVVGVRLNYRLRDEIRRLITDKLLRIQPAISPSDFQIIFHPVHKKKRKIRNLYVLELKVDKPQTQLLYFTSEGDVYIKTDAGKKKLSGAEIQAEVLRRLGRGEIE